MYDIQVPASAELERVIQLRPAYRVVNRDPGDRVLEPNHVSHFPGSPLGVQQIRV